MFLEDHTDFIVHEGINIYRGTPRTLSPIIGLSDAGQRALDVGVLHGHFAARGAGKGNLNFSRDPSDVHLAVKP